MELSASGSFAQPLYSSVRETTPLTAFYVDGVRVEPVSDLFVVGTVREVTGGKGYSWPDGPQVSGWPSTMQVHDFDSGDAQVSTIHLSVAVEESLHLDPAHAGMKSLTVGLALLSPIDIDALATQLEGKRIALPLQAEARSHEPGVFGVLHGGGLLGFVDTTDTVSFPAFSLDPYPGDPHPPVPLAELLDPPAEIRLRTVDGQFVREQAPDSTGDGP